MNGVKKVSKDNKVFHISLGFSIVIVLWGILAQNSFANFASALLNF